MHNFYKAEVSEEDIAMLESLCLHVASALHATLMLDAATSNNAGNQREMYNQPTHSFPSRGTNDV